MLVVVLAWSWWELLFLPLGDSHDGRINGRFGLQIRNLFEDGLFGSGFLSSIEPFSTQPYAHHPPLINVIHASTGAVFGQGEWQLHLVGYASGLLTIVALLWLARELGFPPFVGIGAVALAASTPMFWIYARLGFGMTPALVFLALWVRARSHPISRRWLIGVSTVVAFSSWPAAALVMVVSGWSLRERPRRPEALRVLGSAVVAVLVTLLWASLASTPGELIDHTISRTTSPVGFGAFIDQYRWFYQTLFPGWFRWLIPVAVAASLMSSTTRLVSGSTLVVLAAWTIGLPEAAFVHDYWTYPLLASVIMGGWVMLDWLYDQNISRIVVVAAVGVLAISAFVTMQRDGYRQAYFHEPAAAGALLERVGPSPDQAFSWVNGIEVPRWVSYYWDLPVGHLGLTNLDAANGDDLVLMRLDRLPAWLDGYPAPVAIEGRYALIQVEALRGR